MLGPLNRCLRLYFSNRNAPVTESVLNFQIQLTQRENTREKEAERDEHRCSTALKRLGETETEETAG